MQHRMKMTSNGQTTISNILFTTLFLSWTVCHAGRILVIPLEGSHWVNMDVMIRALHTHGHAVDVIRTDKSWYVKDDSPHYKAITVPVATAFNHDFINPILKNIIAIQRGKSSIIGFVSLQVEMFKAMSDIHGMMSKMATTMLEDEKFMNRLKARNYDLVLTDPAWGAGILLAHALKLPLVYNVRWITSGEGHLAIAPSPLSYIPMTGSGLTDKMTFLQRVENLLFYAIWEIQNTFFIQHQYQAVCEKQFGPQISYGDLLRGADLWLMRVDFVFEFPRPTMPNVIYIGGFQCKPAKALPEHLEEFVQSSGDHGFIMMSLGTFVDELPEDVANNIAAAFAQLPQKVIWKYKGSRPTTLSNNTLVVDWMPQNDLLGHPKIKLFVAHGGTNGVQEAIYHGVPVLGLPLFFDQYDNLLRLQERGAGKIISLAEVDKEGVFLKSIKELLNDPSYKMNMQRVSNLHRDQPIKPMDSALFWIEFVMRHKGAAHLKSLSYTMPWYTYYSVDVFLFLIGAVLFILISTVFMLRCLCRAVCKKKDKSD